MFVDELFALKNRFTDRLQLHFLFSREAQELPIMSGRLDASKVRELYAAFCERQSLDDVYVCGPDSMIDVVSSTLESLGIDASSIHTERFGVAAERVATHSRGRTATGPAEGVAVTIVMDGQKRTFTMAPDDTNLVDAALAAGIELPYSCKGGVCATCRTHLREGDVDMAGQLRA